jgi:hypothetical protein
MEFENAVDYLVYTEDMIEFGDDKKLAKALSKLSKSELKVLGIGLFGASEDVDRLTKGYSLYK